MAVNPVKKQRCLESPNKTRFATQQDAAVASRQIEFRDGRRLYIYECQGCNGWHLTSEPNEEG
jgi:hypothetical protein